MGLEADKILSALRLGVIPNTTIEDLLVGKRAEVEELCLMLNGIKNGQGRFKFIEGAYGTGKSFMLKYLEERALEEGFVTATITISSGFNFSKLDGIYTAIMGQLKIFRGHEKGTSFEEIFDLWITGLRKNGDMNQASRSIYDMIQKLNTYNSSFASVLLIYIRAKIGHDLELARISSAWIKGDKNLPYQLKRQLEIKGNIDKENAIDILRGFNRLLELMGYSGLIVLLDESEIMMNERSDIRMKAYNNIRQLIDATAMGDMPFFGMVFAGTPQFFDDEEKGIRSYQALADRLGVTIATAKKGIDNVRQPLMILQPFSKEDYLQLTTILLSLHENHYGYVSVMSADGLMGLAEAECKKMLADQTMTIRHYSKKLIEILDLMQNNPDLPIFRVNRAK